MAEIFVLTEVGDTQAGAIRRKTAPHICRCPGFRTCHRNGNLDIAPLVGKGMHGGPPPFPFASLLSSYANFTSHPRKVSGSLFHSPASVLGSLAMT